MLFTNKRGNNALHITIQNTELEQKDSCKFLGIFIDKDLNWKRHMQIFYVWCKNVRYCIVLYCILPYPEPLFQSYIKGSSGNGGGILQPVLS